MSGSCCTCRIKKVLGGPAVKSLTICVSSVARNTAEGVGKGPGKGPGRGQGRGAR